MEVTHPATQERAVSGHLSLEAKEQIRQATDIVDLVGHYLQIQRKGRGYVALCPWHDDTRPSLQINPERQSWKCWVCDVGGDVFSFVMKIEGVEFREALEMLAERAGIELAPRRRTAAPTGDGAAAQPGQPEPLDKPTLLRAMAWAEAQYHRCLLDAPEAEPARRYLSERGITDESIAKFRLGFAPDRANWILEQAEGSAARAKVLEAIGILAVRDDGTRYDRFRGRVLFSIHDAQGRPVGLGGRVLPELGTTSPAKYVNSPETPLFAKSHLLYGLDLAKDAIRRGRTALVMEGYTDCIMAHQHGFEDAVAVLGTALGPAHVRILRRYADRVVLVLDGDEAGQRRANEVLELFIAQQVDLRILTLPSGADPCDYLREHGADAFRALVENESVDALEHAIRSATRGVDLAGDVHGASQALEKILSIVAKAPAGEGETKFREAKVLARLARDFGVPEADVRRRLGQLRRRSAPVYRGPAEPAAAEEETPIRLEALAAASPWECHVVELVLAHPALLPAAREAFSLEDFALAPCRRIYEACCRLADEGDEPGLDRLLLEYDEPAMKSLLVSMSESSRVNELTHPEALLEELIARHRRRQTDRQLPAQLAALKAQGLDESQKTDLIEKMMAQLRARHGISEPTDG
ncbi:MAG: DNA primase [Pirellulales bacterium]|nr:DNA primase [Pirellulales bacterium]